MRAGGENELGPLHFHVASQVVDDMSISPIVFPFIGIKWITHIRKLFITWNLIKLCHY